MRYRITVFLLALAWIPWSAETVHAQKEQKIDLVSWPAGAAGDPFLSGARVLYKAAPVSDMVELVQVALDELEKESCIKELWFHGNGAVVLGGGAPAGMMTLGPGPGTG